MSEESLPSAEKPAGPEVPKNRKQPGTFGAISLFVYDFLKVFVIAVAIIIPIRWFLFQPFVVTGDSMKPNFQNGNYLIIDEMTYRFRPPARGETLVLRFPNDTSQFFIKRIIGLPGERVKIDDNGRVTIYNQAHPEGMVLDEKYLPSQSITYGNTDLKLGPDEYFMLGDNRLASSDSRIWGPLPKKDIVGRVFIRVFPLNELRVYASPTLYLLFPVRQFLFTFV